MGLLAVGFAFKVSAIPFQAWTPDVYDGAPAPITAFMSVGTKAAALIAFARVFDVVFFHIQADWQPIIWAITILTIVGGNVLALVQSNVKRMLAYSSIAHAGYLLIGVVVGGTVGIASILFYLLCYAFMNLGAFGVVSILERVDNGGSSYSDIRGLWYRRPLLAGILAIFMFALGLPAHVRLRSQILHLFRRPTRWASRTADHWCTRQRSGHVLLPACGSHHVHGARTCGCGSSTPGACTFYREKSLSST